MATPDHRSGAWTILVGTGVGGLLGFALGGTLARLLMLLLRETSPEFVRGVTSDDGFTIGVISGDTLVLLVACGGIGAAIGTVYACSRFVVRRSTWRLVLATVTAGCVGGAVIVHSDGVDFTLLEPTWLAIGGFVALPAAGAALIGLLTDRWAERPLRRDARGGAVAVGALAGIVSAPLALLAAAAVLLLERRPPRPRLQTAARAGAVLLAIVLAALGALDVGRDIAALK